MRKLIISILLGLAVAGGSFFQSLAPSEQVALLKRVEVALPMLKLHKAPFFKRETTIHTIG